MPTQFSNCDECNYLDWLSIDNDLNKLYKKHLIIYNILLDYGFPEIVGLNILKKMNSVKLCHNCKINKKKLCNFHYIRALKNGKHYTYKDNWSMCCDCCYWECG